MISVAERSLSEGLSASKSGSSSHIAVSARQYINDLENPSFNYVPLFGQETTLQIRTILSCSAKAKSNLRLSTQPVTLGKKQSTLSWLCDWLMISGSTTSDENGEDVKKALNHLEQSSAQLAALFDVSWALFHIFVQLNSKVASRLKSLLNPNLILYFKRRMEVHPFSERLFVDYKILLLEHRC